MKRRIGLKAGTFVTSSYRARWRGVVLESEDRGRDKGCLLRILLLLDRHGHPLRKRRIVRLDEHWVTPCSQIPLSQFNPDWWRPVAKKVKK